MIYDGRNSSIKSFVLLEGGCSVNHYSYSETLAASEGIRWRVEDIIGADKRLDFSKPFLPESLAMVEPLTFLSPDEQRTLNQISGYTYLRIFVIVEEFILPFLLDHARPHLNGDDYRVRALLNFASEEAKHIQLFKRFREEFEENFPVDCPVIGPAEAIAAEVLSHDRLAVALTILQIEWMTQMHYINSVKDDQDLDPQFKSLLRHHWMEEAQHAKIDALMVDALAAGRDQKRIESAVEEYLQIGAFIDVGLTQQVMNNLDSLERAVGADLSESQRAKFIKVQQKAVRWTYLGSGMKHPNFLASLEDLAPSARARVEEVALNFS
jgi:hypothetical protein